MKIDDELLARLPMSLRAEIEENLCRKDFTESELAAIQSVLIAEFGKLTAQGKRSDLATCTGNSVQVEKPTRRENATERVANLFGESERTVRERAEVVQAAQRDPERYGALVEQMDKTGRVNGVHKRLRVMEQAQDIAQEPPPLPDGPFRVIVADPPWTYGNRADDPAHRASNPYPSMTLDGIKALPVADVAADDCVLWLWTTNAHLPVAFEVAEAWGFEYKTMLTWVKDHMGTGDWLRGKTEHCLMCVRGHPTVTLTNQTTVIAGPLREHSRKPDEFYAMVETLCPGGKLELFARAPREGWNAHGNEPNRFS